MARSGRRPISPARRVGVRVAALLVRRVVVDQRVHVAGRDAVEEPRPAERAPRLGALPVGLREDRHPEAVRLEPAAEDRRRERRVVDVRVARDEHDVGRVPAARADFGRSGGKEGVGRGRRRAAHQETQYSLAPVRPIPPCPHRPPCPGCPRYGVAGIEASATERLAALAARAGLELARPQLGSPLGFRTRARLAVRGRAASPKVGIFQTGTPQDRRHPPLRDPPSGGERGRGRAARAPSARPESSPTRTAHTAACCAICRSRSSARAAARRWCWSGTAQTPAPLRAGVRGARARARRAPAGPLLERQHRARQRDPRRRLGADRGRRGAARAGRRDRRVPSAGRVRPESPRAVRVTRAARARGGARRRARARAVRGHGRDRSGLARARRLGRAERGLATRRARARARDRGAAGRRAGPCVDRSRRRGAARGAESPVPTP